MLVRVAGHLVPGYPVVEGDYLVTPDWAVSLPGAFNRRFEDGYLVIWRRGITIWAIAWNNDNGKTVNETLAWLRADPSPSSYDHEVIESADIIHYGYRTAEQREDGIVLAWHARAISVAGHIQLGIYFDLESELPIAKAIWLSLRQA